MFEMLNKKIWANFHIIIELFTQKIVTKLSKIWVWDPGSEIRDPGSGMGKNQDPGSGINIPDPPHWNTEHWEHREHADNPKKSTCCTENLSKV